jgi:ABC-type sugar transport system ATPase subunit
VDVERGVNVPPAKRNVGMVFQNWALYPHMKVFDNIAFPPKIRWLPRHEIEKRVKEVAEALEIGHLLDRYPRQLSGGQQQRVAIARALVKAPQVSDGRAVF